MKVCSQLLALALVWGGDAFMVQDPKAGPKVVVKLAYDDFETRSGTFLDSYLAWEPERFYVPVRLSLRHAMVTLHFSFRLLPVTELPLETPKDHC